MINGIRTQARLLAAAGALAGSMIAAPLAALNAHAAYTICRADPVVMLSNGYHLNIVETVADTSSDIKGVRYSVHIPQGLGVQKIVYTGGALKGKEVVTVYVDNPGGSYTTTSVASTGKGGVATTLTSTLTGTQGLTLASGSASGNSGNRLTVQLQAA